MNYQELSPQGETLLKEIIDLQASGQDNAAYWSKRFDGLSMQQDTLLRDTFRELRECGYVKTQWADNIPYYLSLTVDGHNYFTNKNLHIGGGKRCRGYMGIYVLLSPMEL